LAIGSGGVRSEPKKHISPLGKAFGPEAGEIILKHFDRKTRTTKRLASKLNRQQGKRLAEFIATTSGLPRPPNADSDLGVATLWAGAPHALVNRFRIGRSGGIL
jgi:hypothetical protein